VEYSATMNRPVRCLTASTTLAFASVMATSVVSAAGTTEPPSGSAASGAAPGCAEVGALLDSYTIFVTAVFSGDVAAIEVGLAELPEVLAAAVASAPAEIADEVDTLVPTVDQTVTALEGVDLADVDAVLAVLESTESEATAEAFPMVIEWATDNCGYVQADPFADAPEPPDCETLDAAAAAEASGIDVDVTDLDGSADVSLPGFWTKSCSYGNGAMSISTLSFNSVENAEQFYLDNLDVAGGVVVDVGVGSLPESSMVIQTGVPPDSTVASESVESQTGPVPSVQVAVFEAPIPFSVSFTGDAVDPAAVVAAAEALLAAPTSSSEPPTSVATTTA
jgi:hypothetical protein